MPRKPNNASNNPVIIRDSIEAAAQNIDQGTPRQFDNTTHELNKPAIVQVDGAKPKEWLDEMQFMNEEVTVLVHESTDKNSHPFPEVTVNNRVQRFVRGVEQKVRRCYVERLARARLTTYDNVKFKRPDGEDDYHYPPHTGLVYPFAVIGDSEKGKAWLKKILAEA